MPKPATKPYSSDWLSKREAAHFLGVGPRQIERREAQGMLRKRVLPRRPHERAAHVQYSREDLEAIKAGEPKQYGVVVDNAKPETPAAANLQRIAATSDAGRDPFAGLAAHLAKLSAIYAPPKEPKPWLTLAEAAEYSGLPESYLLAIAREGDPIALNTGTDKRARWRFKRSAL